MVARSLVTIVAVESAVHSSASEKEDKALALNLTVELDRQMYDADDTIMILANFKGNGRAKVQFSDAGSGS